MGAGASSVLGTEGEPASHGTGLGDLPESCVANVMIYLDPPEICLAARLSRTFRGAASADFVWEAKLPENYVYLMGLACGCREERRHFLKEVYVPAESFGWRDKGVQAGEEPGWDLYVDIIKSVADYRD